MAASTSDIQSLPVDNSPLDHDSTSTDVQPATSSESPNNEQCQSESSTGMARAPGQTVIGAKLVKKLETLAAASKGTKPTETPAASTPPTDDASATANIDSESRRAITKAAKTIVKGLTDPDVQKNLLTLATKVAELQEQQQSLLTKTNEIEKRTTTYMRERDHISLENSRLITARTKLESLCRELQRHNQQIREETVQQQNEDEIKRRELAAKFQTTIDGVAAQLADYSEKSAALREQNAKLSEQLPTMVKTYELRQKELETALKKKELELRLTEATIEQSHTLLNERNELVKQEQQVSSAERLVLHKKCEELSASELSLRSQVQMYADRYKEFQGAIQQSSQMVTSCQTEMEKMRKAIKKLENERADFRRRWEMAEQNQRKASEDHARSEKEKQQVDAKMEKLNKLSQVLQQDKIALQTTIRNLTEPSTNNSQAESESVPPIGSLNLCDSEVGRAANTVD